MIGYCKRRIRRTCHAIVFKSGSGALIKKHDAARPRTVRDLSIRDEKTGGVSTARVQNQSAL